MKTSGGFVCRACALEQGIKLRSVRSAVLYKPSLPSPKKGYCFSRQQPAAATQLSPRLSLMTDHSSPLTSGLIFPPNSAWTLTISWWMSRYKSEKGWWECVGLASRCLAGSTLEISVSCARRSSLSKYFVFQTFKRNKWVKLKHYLYSNWRVPLRTEHLSRVFKMSGCLDSDWDELLLVLEMRFYSENTVIWIFSTFFLFLRKCNSVFILTSLNIWSADICPTSHIVS